MERVNETPVRTAITGALPNIPCNITFTVQVEGRPLHTYKITDSNDGRNYLARIAPKDVIMSNPDLVFPHITDGTDVMFEDLLVDAKAIGLPLPAGI